MTTEKRRVPRTNFCGDVMLYFDNRHLLCWAGNVSTTGMMTYTPQPIGLGKCFRLIFALPGKQARVSIDAVLVREVLEKDAYACGLDFLQPDKEVIEELNKFINAKLLDKTTTNLQRPIPRRHLALRRPVVAKPRMTALPLSHGDKPPASQETFQGKGTEKLMASESLENLYEEAIAEVEMTAPKQRRRWVPHKIRIF